MRPRRALRTLAMPSSRADLFQAGLQSALRPFGPQSDATAALALVMTIGAAVIFAAVLLLTARAVWKPQALRSWATSERFVLGAGLVIPFFVLVALLVYVMSLSRVFAAHQPADVTIEIVGEQWWWRVNYLDAQGAIDFATANEVRIPVGRSVELLLKSNDVIHSFWVPGLAGKADMTPGRVHRVRISADTSGVFRGQCAEFCGGQHAQMALYVVAQDDAAFAAWRQRQQTDAARTAGGAAGRALFEANCGVCHAVRGTAAAGTLGPDLTHVGSRLSLAAGMLPNNAGSMAAWIAGSQQIKPGNLMPSMNVVGGEELRAIAAYLDQLD